MKHYVPQAYPLFMVATNDETGARKTGRIVAWEIDPDLDVIVPVLAQLTVPLPGFKTVFSDFPVNPDKDIQGKENG